MASEAKGQDQLALGFLDDLQRHARAIERNVEAAAPAREAADRIAESMGVQLELAPVPVPPPPPAPPEPEPFSRWLLGQTNRRDWIKDLANAAKADRGFPKNGSPDDVRKRLQTLGADGDAFEQVDDAERAWMSLYPEEEIA